MKQIILAVFLLAPVFSSADIRVIGNGGAGVEKNGVYMTFGSAGFFIDPQPQEVIPSLDLVLSTIDDFGVLEDQKAWFKQAIVPMGARKYYNVLKEKLDPDTYRKLQEEYAKAMGQPPQSIVLFAITDVQTKTTYLLPEFYNLKEVEKAAILFHESVWILMPQSTYLDVIQAEVVFQKYIEAKQIGKYDPGLGQVLSKMFGNDSPKFRMSLAADLSLGIFKSSNNKATLKDILPSPLTGWSMGTTEFFGNEFNMKMYGHSKQKYTSLFIKNAVDFLAADEKGGLGILHVFLRFKGQSPDVDKLDVYVNNHNFYITETSTFVEVRTIGSTKIVGRRYIQITAEEL